ncbi:MAG: ABC transporter ATP-binding protein, partial [Patescibacteria group bacterium]
REGSLNPSRRKAARDEGDSLLAHQNLAFSFPCYTILMQNDEISPKRLRFSAKEKFYAYARFLGIIWHAHPVLTSLRFALTFLGAFLQPVEVYFFAKFIAAIAEGDIHQAPFLIGIVIASYGLRHIVSELTYSRMDDWFARASSLASEHAIYAHVTKLDPEALNHPEIRRSLDFVREDLWRLKRLADRTEWLVRSVLKFIGTLALAVAAPWWVTLVALADAALQAVNLWIESKKEIWAAVWNSLEGRKLEYTRYLFLNTDEFRELRMLGAEKAILAKRELARQNVLARFRDIALMSLRNRTVLACLHIVAYTFVILILGRAAFDGPAALATLYIALNLFGLMGDALNGMSGAVTTIWADTEILAYINRLLNFELERISGLKIPRESLTLKLEHVAYRYRNAKRDALSDITLTIREGEHLAMVGENGAGKSTLLKLLSGLILPTRGRILLNGKPLSDYQPIAWRGAFHLLLQDTRLYQDFVRDNLMYGAQTGKHAPGFSMPQSVAIAGANTIIDALPQGYRTFLGDWAAPPDIVAHQVSGGQRQRLVIARTLIHGGRIIGFDEPTSAMDANAEMRFFERLLKTAGKRGLIFISHRFSTVRRADRIFVLHDGKLAGQGSHDELIEQNKKYAELYRQQAQWYS